MAVLQQRYIRGIELIAQKDSEGNLSYYMHNAHGDVVSVVDGSGEVLNSYSYDAFGDTTTYAEKVENRFKYAGEQFDKVTGQYYLRARYYDPQIGRFTQEDPYRGDSLNLYTYVANNPVRFVDPWGLCKDDTQETGKDDVLVVFAAGVDVNDPKKQFEHMKAELEERYTAEGKTVVFEYVNPLGQIKNTNIIKQILEVGWHMQFGTGGKEVVDAVNNYIDINDNPGQIVLIGHSGGGQAVGDAIVALGNMGVKVEQAVQIGAPTEKIAEEYADNVTRVQVISDIVPNNVRIGTELILPPGLLIKSVIELFTQEMPETVYVDINVEGEPWGGHSAYFKVVPGINNVTVVVDAIWDAIN